MPSGMEPKAPVKDEAPGSFEVMKPRNSVTIKKRIENITNLRTTTLINQDAAA